MPQVSRPEKQGGQELAVGYASGIPLASGVRLYSWWRRYEN